MSAPIIPWQPNNIPSEIQAELERRKVNRSFSAVPNPNASWGKDGDWNKYRGPMVSWIRMCSNSGGPTDEKGQFIKPRFVFNSGKGFYKTYGFSQPTPTNPAYQVIGYTPGIHQGDAGVPHIIDNSLITPKDGNFPIHVPTPEISRITATIQQEYYRRVDVEWVCFSWKQLEYMTPYFLIPGITVMLEWGWNHFNPVSLVPLYDRSELMDLWENASPLYTNILNSRGNYDVVYGTISNFSFNIEGNKIICNTEITSKDRLYAGIAKDMSLTVNSNTDSKNDKLTGTFQSLKEFLADDATWRLIKDLANTSDPLTKLKAVETKNPSYVIWKDILTPLLLNGGPEVIGMRTPYVHGVFSGRPPTAYSDFGSPVAGDFDKPVQDKGINNLWINMGLVVEILNHFSKLAGGGTKPMFTVDIMNTVIGGHPNLISCDSRVLIPNAQAPKYHYGLLGKAKYGSTDGKSDYSNQYIKEIPANNKADETLRTTMYQSLNKVCYRNDLDAPINMMRKKWVPVKGAAPGSWAFPSDVDAQLPNSPNGLAGNFVVKDFSGLLSNIYISCEAFKDSVEKGLTPNATPATFVEIYKDILQLLMDSVDGFWDLALVEVENTMTITDKKYVGDLKKLRGGKTTNDDLMYVFDYGDADSIIKSIKFRPALSNAVAIRSMFAGANNKDAKYSFIDKDDSISFGYKDAINAPPARTATDPSDDIEKMATAAQQRAESVVSVQTLNQSDSDDGSLQMTFYDSTVPPFNSADRKGKKEVVKLVLPGADGKQLLRQMLDDKDEDNNQKYCAVQPGITLELTLLGIGGLRTFQYFLIKNLPAPYSHKNIIFRITSVTQSLESGNWETMIQAQLTPLRSYIKRRVPGPNKDGSWPDDAVPK
jgi:hypothetical protein